MDKRRFGFFRRLLDTPSPSGFEADLQRIWRDEVRAFCPDIHTDVHGSVLATMRGRSEKTKFLLLGHADEIGLLVHYIDDNGFLYFKNIGGIDPATLVNQHVRLLGPKGLIHGVVGKIAIHLQGPKERESQKVELSDLWIDIGAKNAEEAAQYAPVGTPAVFGHDTVELLNGRVAARDFDNKMGCFVVAEVLRNLAEHKSEMFATVIGASTVQEETGVWGARQVAFNTNPTAAIAIDVSHATDIPSADKRRVGDFKMGGGPIVNIGVRSNKKLVAAIMEAGRAAGIPVRSEAEWGSHGTDADPAAEIRGGVPVATVSNALRYMHTSVEVADLAEIDQIIDLLTRFLLSVKDDVDYTP